MKMCSVNIFSLTGLWPPWLVMLLYDSYKANLPVNRDFYTLPVKSKFWYHTVI